MNTIAIKIWLHEHGIKTNYSINHDRSVSVSEDVTLKLKSEETEIPIQFATIHGDFLCPKNNLTSFKGFPHTIHGSLYCHEQL